MKCPNCEAPIERIDGFCWNCGQKNKDGRITLQEFFKDILENVLNIDAKVFRTIGHLCIPGKLSKRYFAGKRQQYFSPFRIFFVTAIIFFALLSYIISRDMDTGEDLSDNKIKRIGYYEAFKHELDTARNYTLETFPQLRPLPEALDTLYANLPDYGEHFRSIEYFYLDKSWILKREQVNLSYEELAKYSPEELADRHEVKGQLGKAIFQQIVRLNTDIKSFVLFLLKNLIWMVLVMMIALSIILKLLYVRRKRFLIEHLVFAFHYHSFAFLLYTVLLGLTYWTESEAWVGWGFLGILIYQFFAMRRFYQQGIFKTFVKFCILNFSYLFIFVFSLALTFIVSIFIF